MIEREKFIAFVDEKTKKAFDELNEEDPKLHRLISRAIEETPVLFVLLSVLSL